MQILQPGARVGDLVRVRQQRWRVVDVVAHEDCSLLTLNGAGAANLGVERQFVAPFDLVEPVQEDARPRVGGAHRWRGRLRALIADAGSTEILRSASRADITLLPHQLEPALAVTRGMGTRVLIADEVGLGKTIQAGLIVAELRARGAAGRVLIVTPAGLRDQWVDELQRRFGMDATLLDAREVRQRLSTLAVGVNPWTTHPIVVTSADYIKRPEVLAAVTGSPWDALIIDEAHGAPPGTDRHRAYSSLAGRTPYVVLLTATPHSGNRDAFRSLCALGSQRRVTGGAIGPDQLLVFRRTREEVALGAGRRVHRVWVTPTADEQRMHLLLEEFTAAVRQDRGEADRDAWLAVTMLHKRAFSSARALELTVRRRLFGLTDPEAPAQLFLPLDDGDGEFDQADATPAWTGPALNDTHRERVLLSALADAAARAAASESKIASLSRLLAALGRRGEHALVFTEYRDTLHHLQGRLSASSGVLHGGLTRAERKTAVSDFDGGRTRILLATDAAGEGLNLHRACRVVVNLELPWSPVRLEQRVGRVDRIGQRQRVHAFHLIARGTGEAAVAGRLRSRIAISRAEIGGADPLGDASLAAETLAAQDIIGGWRPDRSGDRPVAIEPVVRSCPEAPRTEHLFRRIRLTPEASAEHARLERARRLIRRGVSATAQQDRGPLIARAGTPAMRALLGTAWLVVIRSAIEDACGRAVAVCITPMRLHMGPLPRAPLLSMAKGAVHEIEECVSAAVRRDREAWVAHSVQWHSAFWAARIAREHAQPVRDDSGELFQLGLFTRRADRLGPNQHAEAADARRGVVEVVRRTSELRVTAGRVALLIVP